MSIQADAARSQTVPFDRGVAFVCYGFMFFATFSFGLLALLGVFLAYSRRNSPDLVARSHFRKQIRNFWWDIALIVIGAVAGYLALAGGLGALIGLTGVRLPGGVTFQVAGWTAIALGAAWAMLWLWGFLNLIVGSLFGAARLATGRPIGHLPAA